MSTVSVPFTRIWQTSAIQQPSACPSPTKAPTSSPSVSHHLMSRDVVISEDELDSFGSQNCQTQSSPPISCRSGSDGDDQHADEYYIRGGDYNADITSPDISKAASGSRVPSTATFGSHESSVLHRDSTTGSSSKPINVHKPENQHLFHPSMRTFIMHQKAKRRVHFAEYTEEIHRRVSVLPHHRFVTHSAGQGHTLTSTTGEMTIVTELPNRRHEETEMKKMTTETDQPCQHQQRRGDKAKLLLLSLQDEKENILSHNIGSPATTDGGVDDACFCPSTCTPAVSDESSMAVSPSHHLHAFAASIRSDTIPTAPA